MKEIELTGSTGKIAALEMGHPDGRPVLAVHGWLDNAASFIPLASQLQDYRWICIDLPGHGKSAHRPKAGVYHMASYVADIISVTDALKWSDFTFVGHSLGAGISSLFAAAFPPIVQQLVLLDGIGPVSEEEEETLPRFMRAMVQQKNQMKENAARKTRPFKNWEQLIDTRMGVSSLTRDAATLLMHRAGEQREDGIHIRNDFRLKNTSPVYMTNGQICRLLAGIISPTLLVKASKGTIASRPTTNKRIDCMQNIVLQNVDGFHHVHMDSPALTAELIREFLQ